MSFPPLRRSSSAPNLRSMSSSSSAGSVGSSGSDDDWPSRSRSSSDASELSVASSPISPPVGPPSMTLVTPSYNQACSARDASRARFERQNLDAELNATTVKNDTAHLGGTVGTVRNYLNASAAAAHSEIEALDAVFGDAARTGTDIKAPLQDLDRLFAKTEAFIEGMLGKDCSEFIKEARSHRDTAHGGGVLAVTHDTRCVSAQAALRLLGKSMNLGFDSLQGHMKAAEVSYSAMANEENMVPKTADIFKSQGETVLCSLDTVLQHGLDAKPEGFDMDGFIQLLYSKNALGSTISSAASRYSASVPEIRDFVSHISDTDTQQTAHDVATEMFRDRDHIDFGAYLLEIKARVPESEISTAQEALKAAMKYMIPIKVGDRNSHPTG